MTATARVTETIIALWNQIPLNNPQTVWSKSGPGVMAMITGVPFPTLNGVWALGDAAERSTVEALLDALPADGLTYCLQTTGALREKFRGVADARGMITGPDIPTMILESPPAVAETNLAIRELAPDEWDARAVVACAGFGVDPEAIIAATQVFGRVPGYRVYLGEVGGRAVTTAVSIATANNSVGIFDVATDPQHRGHGYGAAITAHAIQAGFDKGAQWSWLQSSEQGFRVYERLGYRTVDTWALWISGT